MNSSPQPRRFAVLPLAKRPAAGRPAVRRYIIVPATHRPAAGTRGSG